jgi:hypothetical protein
MQNGICRGAGATIETLIFFSANGLERIWPRKLRANITREKKFGALPFWRNIASRIDASPKRRSVSQNQRAAAFGGARQGGAAMCACGNAFRHRDVFLATHARDVRSV